MQNINEIACEANKTNMFVTLFIGVLDLPTEPSALLQCGP